MSRLNKLQSHSKDFWFAAVTTVLLSFSFYPAINVAVGSSTIQISMAIVVFMGLSFVASLSLSRDVDKIMSLKEKVLYASLIFISLQLFIQGEGGRGILIAGVWAAIAVVLSLRISERAISGYVFGFIATSLVLTLLAVGQIGLEAVGYNVGLPAAYRGDLFGFARATLFFEEPQFLASYILIGMYLSICITARYRYCAFGMLTFGLALTLSRGAALGAVVSFGVLSFYYRQQPKEVVRLGLASFVGLTSGVIFLSLSGWVRSDQQISPAYFTEVYTRQILGLDIERSSKLDLKAVESSSAESHSLGVGQLNSVQLPESTVSSAGSRFVASKQAFRDATDTPQTFIFGRGPGSYNVFMEDKFGPSFGNGYTVNNVYVEFLFEFGVVAFIALLTLIISMCVKLYRFRSELATAIVLAIVAVSVQQLFFGSIVNNLHYWVLFAVGLSVCAQAQKANIGVAASKSSSRK